MKSILFVGMDVHKNSFNLCCYNRETGEYVAETRCASDVKLVEKFIEQIKKNLGNDEIEFKCGYEAGCLGFSVYEQLAALGIECDILAPTTMKLSAKNKVVKNDKMDARNIAENLGNGTYKAVHIPDEEDLAVKEFIRMICDAKSTLKKNKQQILSFLLRHGYQYDGKSKWTIAHIKWIRSLQLKGKLQRTLDEYMAEYEHQTDRIERYAKELEEIFKSERYNEAVSKIRCFKGIDTTAGMTIQVETSDFDRFPNAKAYASYVGLTSGEHSSGDKNIHTSITKQGNSKLRTTYVECAQALIKGTVYSNKSKRLKARQAGQSSDVINYADRAVKRLMKKYQSLTARNVPHNKAVVAVARELACFVWGMETGNIH